MHARACENFSTVSPRVTNFWGLFMVGPPVAHRNPQMVHRWPTDPHRLPPHKLLRPPKWPPMNYGGRPVATDEFPWVVNSGSFKHLVFRRGLPRSIYSDNDANFIGALKELTTVYGLLGTFQRRPSYVGCWTLFE